MKTDSAFEALKERFGHQFLDGRSIEGFRTLEAHAPNGDLTKPMQLVFGETIEVHWEFGYFCDFMWSTDAECGRKDADAWVAELSEFLREVMTDQVLCLGVFRDDQCVGGGPVREDEIDEILTHSEQNSTVRVISWSGKCDAIHFL
jgi:hypothetical protein